METKNFANDSNLPEEGAHKPDKEVFESNLQEKELSEASPIEDKTHEVDEPATSNEPEQIQEVEETVEQTEPVENESTEVPEAGSDEDAKNDDPASGEPETEIEEVENEDESDSEKKETEKDEMESSEEQQAYEKPEEEDYTVYSRLELLTKLNELVNNYDVEDIKDLAEEIKVVFYKKLKTETNEARKKFIDEGGNPEDFKFHDDSSEETFKEIYNQYREKKTQLNSLLEEEKQDNLKQKYQIIEEIKELINKEESINKTFQEFRDLQQRWREIGLVPQNEVKNLWENYNHNVEKFYDYIKINKELRDLDLKKNLEMKIELCEKAEELVLEDSVTKAFKTLQEYHHQWREIGPVPAEQKDDIWERFKAATTQINKQHQDYFEGLRDQQIKNLEQKVALCEQVEELNNATYDKPKDWEDSANKLIEIQKLWRTIGFAPKKENNRIYQRFKKACDEFFTKKREFYKEAKEVQKDNLQLKLDLCIQAEALKDSTEWKKTTEDFINLQKMWKQIGPVPKKHSEILWKRFRTACDSFFKAKSEFFSTIDSRQEDNLKAKLDLIERVKTFKKLSTDKENLQALMDLQKEWSEIGHVPLNKKDEIQKVFREAINAQFEKLKIENSERNKLNFKNKLDSWVSTNSRNKLYSERNKMVTKIRELENEIALYENNIGFFSKSSNSEALMGEIHKKIENARQRMESMKEKLRLLDDADQEID